MQLEKDTACRLLFLARTTALGDTYDDDEEHQYLRHQSMHLLVSCRWDSL